MHRESKQVWRSDTPISEELLVRNRDSIFVVPSSCTPELLWELGMAIQDCLDYIDYVPPERGPEPDGPPGPPIPRAPRHDA